MSSNISRLDPSVRNVESSPVDNAAPVGQVADSSRPTRVPESIKAKMKLLESGRSSKLWRVAKNVGAGLVGAGVALALASNPVGWAVTAAVVGVGAVALVAGTITSMRADLAKADVEAFKQSVAGSGPVKDTASFGRKTWLVLKNLAESAAFGVAGFFAGAGAGAAFHATAFKGMLGAHQSVSSAGLVNKIAMPAIYGVGGLAATLPGVYFDHSRNRDTPEIRYQQNISEGLEEYTGPLKDDVPQSAAAYPFFAKGRSIADKVAQRDPDERAQVTVNGPVARHLRDVARAPVGHSPGGAILMPRSDGNHTSMSDEELLAAMSAQREEWVNKKVRGSGYAIKRIPDNRPLFQGGPPKLADIRQSHRRADCYLLGGLAGALVRDGGWQKIEQIMQDNGDGTVTVRLPHEDVTVQKTRLVTENGYNALNSGADWVHLLEKAVAASMLAIADQKNRKFDMNKFGDGHMYLGHLMGPPQHDAGNPDALGNHKVSGDLRHTDDKSTWQGIIEHSLANGLPVAFETRDADYKGKMRKRMTPDHVYAVVGTAVRNSKPGYMVFDPYGSSVGSHPQVQLLNNRVTLDRAQRGNSPLFFVSVDEAKDLFDRLDHSLHGVPPRRPSVDQMIIEA